MRTRRLRRIFTLAGAACLAAGAMLVVAPTAAHAATPFPAGSTTWNASGTFSFTVSGSAAPVNFTASMKGTSDGAGNITFPKSQINFPSISVTLIGQAATVHISPTTNWTGTIDTTSGKVTLTGSLMTLIDIPGVGATSCGLGPITPLLSSANSGGKAYSQPGKTGTASVIDSLFAVPTATNPSGTCPITALIDATLGLPIAKGSSNASNARFILDNLTIFPPGVTPPPPTTVPPPTVPPAAESATSCQPLTVTGSGFQAGSTVTIIFDQGSEAIGLAEATVDVNGAFTKVVTVPDVQAGAHSVVIVGTSTNGVAKQQSRVVNVTSGCVASGAGQLPRTGSSTFPITLVGVVLMLAGIALVGSQRRRITRH